MTSLMNYPLELIYCDWHDCTQLTEIKNRQENFKLLHKHLLSQSLRKVTISRRKQTSYKEKKGKQETFDLNDFRSKSKEKRMWKQTYVSPKLNQMLNSMYHTLANTLSLSLFHTRTYTHTLTHSHTHTFTRTHTHSHEQSLLSFIFWSTPTSHFEWFIRVLPSLNIAFFRQLQYHCIPVG